MFQHVDAPVPQINDVLKMWQAIAISQKEDISPSVLKYIEALKKVYLNGNVLYSQFFVPENDIFDWYASRNRFHEMGFFEKFWHTDTVKTAFPFELADLNFYDEKIFKWSSPFVLGGSMAWVLSSGGPYERHAAGPVDAKNIADEAAADLIQNQYDDILVYEAHCAWSDFYMDIAWDCTWVIVDKTSRRIHVLMATDTD